MKMLLTISLMFGALGYLIYVSKKDLSLDEGYTLEISKENDDLYKGLEDLFI